MVDVVNIGTSANAGDGDPFRTAMQKVNAKFDEIGDGGGGGISDLANDPDTTTGLTYGFKSGVARNIAIDGLQDDIDAGTVTLADDTLDQSVYLDSLGLVVAVGTSGQVPDRAFMMALVSTASGQITSIRDKRPFVNYLARRTLSSFSADFEPNAGSPSGLTFSYGGATNGIMTPSGIVGSDGIDSGTLTLADNTVNYVECDETGTVSSNTVGFTTGLWPIAKVTTSSGQFTEQDTQDKRTFIYIPDDGGGLTDFANDPATTVGLDYGFKAGKIRFTDGGLAGTGGDFITLPDDTNTILVYWIVGAGVAFTTGDLPFGAFWMATVDTAAGEITNVQDNRAFANAFGAYSSYIVSALPDPTTLVGLTALVTDATAPTFGDAVVGSGDVVVPVYSDGTIWRVG